MSALRPEQLRALASNVTALTDQRIAYLLSACADRISELEDTIDMEDASRDINVSFGRDKQAMAVFAEIAVRRGNGWRAMTSRTIQSVHSAARGDDHG